MSFASKIAGVSLLLAAHASFPPDVGAQEAGPGRYLEPLLLSDSTLTEPTLSRTGDHCEIRLPPVMLRLLQDSIPAFRLWAPEEFCAETREYVPYKCESAEAMSAVVGDFDGNGARDIVLDGHDTTTIHCLILFSRPTGCELRRIGRPSAMTGDECCFSYFEYRAPGRYRSSVEGADVDPPIVVETDAFEQIWEGKGSMLYYFKQGNLIECLMSD